MMKSDQEKAREICELIGCRWQEEYYGLRCENCGEFIPYGCEPWLPLEDDGYDDDGVDFEFEGSHWVDWDVAPPSQPGS